MHPYQRILIGAILLVATASVVFTALAHAQAPLAWPAPVQSPGDDIPEGFMLIHGDVIVPNDYYDQPEGAYATNRWPDGIVYYEFDANVTPANKALMLAAMEEWIANDGVAFVPRSPWSTNWLHIQASNANNSFVGMVSPGQVVNIFNWGLKYIMAHELCHALGFWHEQSRPDRNAYVQINYGDICQDCCGGGPCDRNFDIVPTAQTFGAYDFESVMHYDQYAFSSTGSPTITVLPPYEGWQDLIGQREHLSDLDQASMNAVYSHTPMRYVDTLGGLFPIGTLSHPFQSIAQAEAFSPSGSTVFVEAGTYGNSGSTLILSRPGTWRPHSGPVIVDP